MRRLFKYRYGLVYCLALGVMLYSGIGCRQDRAAPERMPVPCAPCVSTSTEPATVWLPVAGRTVILDPGHGGKDAGAGHFGLLEKDITLDLALRTAALLRPRGVVVLFTRDTDVFIPLGERSAFANARPNATFVSIHVNASDKNPEATGIETFVLTQKFSDGERGRTVMEKFSMEGYESMAGRRMLGDLAARCRTRGPELAARLQTSLTGRLAERDRGVKTANLAVLRETYFCTAVLVEVGFLSNERTADRMRTEEWRRQTADAMAEGIVAFLRQPDGS